MPNENIDNLMIGLGLEVSHRDFQEGRSAILGLRSAGLATGAVLTAAGVAMNEAQKQAGEISAWSRQAEALGLSADEADRLGFALEQVGGESDNAISTLEQVRDLRDSIRFGEGGGLLDAALYGIDPKPIMQAQSEMAALLELARQVQGLDERNRNKALSALGLDATGQANLLRGGAEQMQALMDRASELRTLTEQEVEASQELMQAQGELSRAFDELQDQLTLGLAPALTEIIEAVTNWFDGGDEWSSERERQYRESLTNHAGMPPEAFGNEPEQPDRYSGSVKSDTEYRRAVARMEREIGAPPGLLWAQIGQESSYDPRAVSEAGAKGLAQIMPDTEASLEEKYFGGEDLDPFDPRDSLDLQGALMRENYQASGDWDTALRMYHGGPDRSKWGPVNRDYVPSIRARMEADGGLVNPQASTTINATINVDGARDPQATAQAIRHEVRTLAQRASDDFRSSVV